MKRAQLRRVPGWGRAVFFCILILTAAGAYAADHGFRLVLPGGWKATARHGADDVAELRFEHANPSLTGFYQVYENIASDVPKTWYEAARSRYERGTGQLPGKTSVEFSDLEPARVGGQAAWTFGFVVSFKSGAPVATQIVFLPRPCGPRIDMHEIVIFGDAPDMAAGRKDVQALLDAVTFTVPSSSGAKFE